MFSSLHVVDKRSTAARIRNTRLHRISCAEPHPLPLPICASKMGFEFGVLQKLDFKITLYCFVIVVAFVIGVEYVFGILEYYLEGSRLYTKMIHMIYKELMLMGMLTFCVMMYEAVPTDKNDVIEEEWLTSIDFSHVYLFFVTFFFVSHAFYLMAMSVSAVSEYRLMFSERTASLVESLQDLKKSCIGSCLFYLKLLPVCNTRYHVEFSMVQSLFTRLYKLPEDLDFPYYLSGCFDRVALKIINRSIFTWIVLLFIVVCNYSRIRYNLTGRTFKYVCGLLGVQVTDEEAGRGPTTLEDTLFIFMVCGTVLVVYTILLTLISRIYKARLVDRVYPNHNSIDDYIGVMKAKLAEQQQPNERVKALRISSADLKKEIEIEFDIVEEGEEEDEEGIKYAAQTMLAVYKYVADSIEAWSLYIRVTIHSCCCGDDRGHRGASRSLLARSTSSVGDVERSGAGAKKSVTEAKAVYVPLRRRLKFSKAQRDLLCHRLQALSERDSLIARSAPSYGALSTSEPEETAATESSSPRPHRAEEEDAGCCGNCNKLLCCTCCDSEWDDANLNSIFFASKPVWYFRAVELQVMFTCMYMALWATNFVSLVRNTEDYSLAQEVSYQLMMVVPILFAYYRIAYIAETYALINAICELNIEVLYEVLVNTEDMKVLASELRAKINAKISAWAGVKEPSEEQERTFVQLLFEEIDQDGSGAIDKGEFRMLLRKLNLNYSDHRFNLLFRALDSVGGDGSVEEQDLVEFMFPSTDGKSDTDGNADALPSAGLVGSANAGAGAGGSRMRQRAQSAEQAFILASLRATREMQIDRTFVATTFSSTHDRSHISRPIE